MNKLYVCFCLEASPVKMTNSDSEENYQNVYKHLATFLHSHQNFSMSFSFNGNELQFLKEKHPEFINILQELIARKQIEIFGGGFYNPVFPLLYSKDRTDQVEIFTSNIRQVFGKRPRGITVCAGSWDCSLVTNFETCGMEYVMLDSSLVPQSKQLYIPLFMSDRGKSISIIQTHRKHKISCDVSCDDYISALISNIKKATKGDKYDNNFVNRIVAINITCDEYKNIFDTKYFERFLTVIEETYSDTIKLSCPSIYLKTNAERIPSFITAGLDSDIAQWAKLPYKSITKSDGYPVTIYDFLQTYPQSQALCNRMLYVSMLINQSHGDKARKKVAREKLWEAQCGEGFICTTKGALVNAEYRQNAYRNLTEAEKILRECSNFEESATRFDYNGDGIDEYMFRMDTFTSCIMLYGGEICELSVIRSLNNYADNLSRIEEFDGCTDNYTRGLFVDHIFSDSDLKKYIEGKPSTTGIFSEVQYTEQKFLSSHKELNIFASAILPEKLQCISVRKKYIANSAGFTVQYILKNESDKEINTNFVVESNFAKTNYDNAETSSYKVSVISEGQTKEIDCSKSSSKQFLNGVVSDVSTVHLLENNTQVSFIFDVNEVCDFSFLPITFKRPQYTDAKIVDVATSFAISMLWKINLEAGKETEKTINFNIISMKRRSVKS